MHCRVTGFRPISFPPQLTSAFLWAKYKSAPKLASVTGTQEVCLSLPDSGFLQCLLLRHLKGFSLHILLLSPEGTQTAVASLEKARGTER